MQRRGFFNVLQKIVLGFGAISIASTLALAQPRRPAGDRKRDAADGGMSRSGRINVIDLGARGDGDNDDSNALQAAIDKMAASGGGRVELPPGEYRCIGLVLKPKVDLQGLQNRTILRASGPGTILTVQPRVRQVSIQGLSFKGLTDASPSVGLVLHGIGNFVAQCDFEGFADEAIIVADGGLVHHLRDIFVDNCLRRAQGATVRGALTIAAHDCTLYNVEIAGGLGTALGQVLEPGDTNWCIYIQGSNTFMTDCVAEVGQGGIRFAATSQQNRISNTRSDLHARHGWYIEGTRSQFSNCIALNCGLEGIDRNAAVGWPSWYIAVASHNSFTNCRSHLESYAGRITHGFEEFGEEPGQDGNVAANNLVACTSLGHSIAAFATKTAGPILGNNVHYFAEWLGSGEEIDVYNLGALEIRATSPLNITNFKGVQGQRLVVVGASERPSTTIQNGQKIKLRSTQALLVQPNMAYEFINVRGVWYQLV